MENHWIFLSLLLIQVNMNFILLTFFYTTTKKLLMYNGILLMSLPGICLSFV